MKHGSTPKPESFQHRRKSVPTSNWCLIARKLGEPLKKRKQMTAQKAGALGDCVERLNSIDWKKAQREVGRLQVRIAKAKNGFKFLGQTFRKHGRVLHIKPAPERAHALMEKVGTVIRKHVGAPMPTLIKELNTILRGWVNYHRHVVASEAFL